IILLTFVTSMTCWRRPPAAPLEGDRFMLHSLLRAALAALVLCAGAHASDKGVTPTEIKLGASAVLSGPLGAQTADYGVGARLYFDALNAAGGVHGRKITYTTLDDGFDTKRAVENTRKLIDEEGVFII